MRIQKKMYLIHLVIAIWCTPFASGQNVTNPMHRSAEAKRTIYTFHADVIRAECNVEKVKKKQIF